jgi:hypothetical protein
MIATDWLALMAIARCTINDFIGTVMRLLGLFNRVETSALLKTATVLSGREAGAPSTMKGGGYTATHYLVMNPSCLLFTLSEAIQVKDVGSLLYGSQSKNES